MKKFLTAVLVLVVLLVAVGFFLPTTYRIEEKITIKTDTVRVHQLVGDLKRWEEWAPWYADDPTIVTSYGDRTTGVGASQTWTSEKGDGELTFTKCDPLTGIAYDMAFIMEGTRAPAVCTMVYETKGSTTKVVWTMEGDVGDFMPPILAGYMNIVMKSSISSMFQTGLETLRDQAEA